MYLDIASEVVQYTELSNGVPFLLTCAEFYTSHTLWLSFCSVNLASAPLACSPKEDLRTYSVADLRRLVYRTLARMHNWSLAKPKLRSFRRHAKREKERLRCVVPGTGLLLTSMSDQERFTLSCYDSSSGNLFGSLNWEPGFVAEGLWDGWKAERNSFLLSFVLIPGTMGAFPLAQVIRVDVSDRQSPSMTRLFQVRVMSPISEAGWDRLLLGRNWVTTLHDNLLIVSGEKGNYIREFGVIDLQKACSRKEMTLSMSEIQMDNNQPELTPLGLKSPQFIYEERFYHSLRVHCGNSAEPPFRPHRKPCYCALPLTSNSSTQITHSNITMLPCFDLEPIQNENASVPLVSSLSKAKGWLPIGRCTERGRRLVYHTQYDAACVEPNHLIWATFPDGLSSAPASYCNTMGSVTAEMGYAERHLLMKMSDAAGTDISFKLLTFAEHNDTASNFGVHELSLPDGFRLEDHLGPNGIDGKLIDEYLGYFAVGGKDAFFVFSYL